MARPDAEHTHAAGRHAELAGARRMRRNLVAQVPQLPEGEVHVNAVALVHGIGHLAVGWDGTLCEGRIKSRWLALTCGLLVSALLQDAFPTLAAPNG